MAKFITLDATKLQPLRNIDERLVSYNIEMTEVTGGTFWKAAPRPLRHRAGRNGRWKGCFRSFAPRLWHRRPRRILQTGRGID